MSETDLTKDAMSEPFNTHIRQAPGYELPTMTRAMIRIEMGVPGIKSEALLRRELALARA